MDNQQFLIDDPINTNVEQNKKPSMINKIIIGVIVLILVVGGVVYFMMSSKTLDTSNKLLQQQDSQKEVQNENIGNNKIAPIKNKKSNAPTSPVIEGNSSNTQVPVEIKPIDVEVKEIDALLNELSETDFENFDLDY